MIVASCQLSMAILSTYSAVEGGAITGGAGGAAAGAKWINFQKPCIGRIVAHGVAEGRQFRELEAKQLE